MLLGGGIDLGSNFHIDAFFATLNFWIKPVLADLTVLSTLYSQNLTLRGALLSASGMLAATTGRQTDSHVSARRDARE